MMPLGNLLYLIGGISYAHACSGGDHIIELYSSDALYLLLAFNTSIMNAATDTTDDKYSK
jgi:hypothetical protein